MEKKYFSGLRHGDLLVSDYQNDNLYLFKCISFMKMQAFLFTKYILQLLVKISFIKKHTYSHKDKSQRRSCLLNIRRDLKALAGLMLCLLTSLSAHEGGLTFQNCVLDYFASTCSIGKAFVPVLLVAYEFLKQNSLEVQQCGLKYHCLFSPVLFSPLPHRLVEIAESRFPRYFNNEEKLLLTSSKVHLYRELSCDEVLQRYTLNFVTLVVL